MHFLSVHVRILELCTLLFHSKGVILIWRLPSSNNSNNKAIRATTTTILNNSKTVDLVMTRRWREVLVFLLGIHKYIGAPNIIYLTFTYFFYEFP